MLNKVDELKISIQNTNPTMILITQIWFNTQVPHSSTKTGICDSTQRRTEGVWDVFLSKAKLKDIRHI